MAFLKSIGLLTSVVLATNAQCTINGTEYTYNNYSCAIVQFMKGVNGLPDTFGGSDDFCDGTWIDQFGVICTDIPKTVKLNLVNRGFSGCPNWETDLPDEVTYISFSFNDLNCSALDLTHLPTYVSGFYLKLNEMTGSIVWPLQTTTITYFDIQNNGFEGNVDLSMIDTPQIAINNNEFTTIDLNSIRDGVKYVYANDNAFTGIVNLSNIPDSIKVLYLGGNDFDSPIDFSPMETNPFVFNLDTTVQCDASIYCQTNEISANRTNTDCTTQATCEDTCVCIPAPISCKQCRKNCKDVYHLCWKPDKTDLVLDECNTAFEQCFDRCAENQCLN